MKKYIFVASIIFLLAFALIFYENPSIKKRELIKELTPLECDLNKTSCNSFHKNKEVVFEFEPKPLKILKETKIIIKNLPKTKDLNARLYGLNMYMGDIVSEFEMVGDNYEGYIVFSSCIEATMRYRFELFSGDKSLGIYVDFDVEK